MKILVLTNKMPYPPRDGGSIATLNMMKGLHETGHHITCLAMNTSRHPFPLESVPETLRSAIGLRGVDLDTSIRPARMLLNLLFTRRAYIAERFHSRDYGNLLREVLRSEHFDVLLLEGPYPGHYLAEIRRWSRSPVLLRAHNVEHLIWRRKSARERSILRKWYLGNMSSRLERFEMDVVRGTDGLVPISETDEACFRQSGHSGPMITIPAGLPLKDYPFSPLPADPTLFFIGALDWLPNQEGLEWFITRVFHSLLERVPDLMFHVAGRNAPEQFIRKLNHRRIVFHGEVEEARQFMRNYRVMVAPLLTGSGIRVKILEGMALGRPVVTTPTGIEGIPATHNREVLVSSDPLRFSEMVSGLLMDDVEAERIAGAGLELVRHHFDHLVLAQQLDQFMKSLL